MINYKDNINILGYSKQIFIAFSSRNSLYYFQSYITRLGFSNSIINTPRGISISCGLSLKIDASALTHIINIIRQNQTTGFIGIFVSENSNLGEKITKIY